MTAIIDALEAARHLRDQYVGPGGYALAYGSHAQGTASVTSDLDLLFVDTEPLTSIRLASLIQDVKNLHIRHGFGLDEEVAYEVKLHATIADVESAVALRSFPTDRAGHLSIPAITPERAFLNSIAFKWRLILNALTTQHIFLGGNATAFIRDRTAASRAITKLAQALTGGNDPKTPTLVHALTAGRPEDPRGKDFLGYDQRSTTGAHLFGVIQHGLAPTPSDEAQSFTVLDPPAAHQAPSRTV